MMLSRFCQLNSVGVGHHHIGEQNVGTFLLNIDHCGGSAIVGNGVEAAVVENHCNTVGDDLFVIDNEHTRLVGLARLGFADRR